MLAITLDQVRTGASVLSAGFVALSAISAWTMKTVAKKAIVAVLFAALAIGVWSQRASVTSCASNAAKNVLASDTTCTFFGFDVAIPTGVGRSAPRAQSTP